MNVTDELAALGIYLRHSRDGQHRAPCPACAKGPHDDALAVRIDGSRAMFQCFRCGQSGAVGERSSQRQGKRPAPQFAVKRDDARVRQIAAELWSQSLPLANTIGADYLQQRACSLPPADGDLRFHSSLFCAKTGNCHPALIAKVTTVIGNRFAGVHRIYLRPGCDRAVAKMRLGKSDEPVCVRLWPDEAVERSLHVAEGVETALAAAQIRVPVWATIDAGQMSQFPVIAGIESIGIFGDNDAVGLRAARDCARRWRDAGREVVAVTAAEPGADINDVVRGRRDHANI